MWKEKSFHGDKYQGKPTECFQFPPQLFLHRGLSITSFRDKNWSMLPQFSSPLPPKNLKIKKENPKKPKASYLFPAPPPKNQTWISNSGWVLLYLRIVTLSQKPRHPKHTRNLKHSAGHIIATYTGKVMVQIQLNQSSNSLQWWPRVQINVHGTQLNPS